MAVEIEEKKRPFLGSSIVTGANQITLIRKVIEYMDIKVGDLVKFEGEEGKRVVIEKGES